MSIFHFIPLRLQTDEQLMQQAAEGNDSAFEELYRRYVHRLQGFFFRQMGGDEDLAADMTHDVFLRAYEARKRYQANSSISAWFFTIAYNLCKNHYRNNAYETQVLASIDTEIQTEQQIELEMDAETLDRALGEVLQALPPTLHQLFSLHYEEELTVPQIAQITGLPEGTVKSRLHKTMNMIRIKLKEYENN